MSKIICDICGTGYSDTEDKCPICGYSREFNDQSMLDENDLVIAGELNAAETAEEAAPVVEKKEDAVAAAPAAVPAEDLRDTDADSDDD